MIVEAFAWVCGDELPLLTRYASKYNRSLSRAFRVKACMIFIAAAWSRVFLWMLERLTEDLSLTGAVVVTVMQAVIVHMLVGLLAYGTKHPHTVDHMMHEFTSFRWKDTFVLIISRFSDDLTPVNTLLVFVSFVALAVGIVYVGPRLLKLFFATSETHWKAQSFNASALSVPLGFAFNTMVYVMLFGKGPRMLSAEASDDLSEISRNSRVVLLLWSVMYVVALSYIISFIGVEVENKYLESVHRQHQAPQHRLQRKEHSAEREEQKEQSHRNGYRPPELLRSESELVANPEDSLHGSSQLTNNSDLPTGISEAALSTMTDIESNIHERDDDTISISESVMTDAVAEMDRFDAAEFFVETTTAVEDLAGGGGLETNLLDSQFEEEEAMLAAGQQQGEGHTAGGEQELTRTRLSSVAHGRSSMATPRQRVSRAVRWGLKLLFHLFAASSVGWAWVASFLLWAAEDKRRKEEFEEPENSWTQVWSLLTTALLASIFGNANIWRLHVSASNHIEYYSTSTRRRIRMLLTSYALVVGVCWEEFFVTLLDVIGHYDTADGVIVKSLFATFSTVLFLYVQFVIEEHSNQTSSKEANIFSRGVYKLYEWWFVSTQKKQSQLRQVQGEYEFAVEQRLIELEQHGLQNPRRYIGWWSDGMWSMRHNLFPSAILSLFLPWLLAAQLAERVNGIGHVMIPVCRFAGVLAIFGTITLVLVILWAVVLPWWTMWIAYFSIGIMVCCVRLRIRTVFMIPGTWWADLGVSLALWCCVLSQMARHVFRYSKVCDTSQPLCPEQIEKVETTQPNGQSAGSAQ